MLLVPVVAANMQHKHAARRLSDVPGLLAVYSTHPTPKRLRECGVRGREPGTPEKPLCPEEGLA